MTFGFYYPVQLFSFSGLGCNCFLKVIKNITHLKKKFRKFQVAFFFLPSKKNMTWNTFMLTSLVLGNSVIVTLISVEHYSRVGSHCPKKSVTCLF